MTSDTRHTFEAEVDQAARGLIVDLIPPGALYLVRWSGTRKGSGTFYTRSKLTLPTVRRTLEPLLYLSGEEGRLRAPEALLDLKICDPSMGCGNFLLAALHVLTSAVIQSLSAHDRISRTRKPAVACDRIAEPDRALPDHVPASCLEAMVQRAVLERCLYGVDRDPLAVALAKATLWVESFDKDLPLTALDHTLRCGDALIGTWMDRVPDYPLLALHREVPNLEKQTHGVGKVAKREDWSKALKRARKEAASRQARILGAARPRSFHPVLRSQTMANPDKLPRGPGPRIPSSRNLESLLNPGGSCRLDACSEHDLSLLREAFDTWCALWFWPLDKLDVLPMPDNFLDPPGEVRSIVGSLKQEKRFFHWEIEFPEVFTGEDAGFDAVVGNPPWEIQKPNSREFFSRYDPFYRGYGKQEALRVQEALFQAHPEIVCRWLAYLGDFKDRANFVRHAAEPFGDGKITGQGVGQVALARGEQNRALHQAWRRERRQRARLSDPEHPYRHQGNADLNTYKLFLEQVHALVRQGGQFGLIVPSGLYTDQGTRALRRLILERCNWRWLYGFENRNKLFDIDCRFKFSVIIAEKGGTSRVVNAAFMRHDLADWDEAKGRLAYPAECVRALSPRSFSVTEIRSQRDLDILSRIHENAVPLGDDGPQGWGVTQTREFDMTLDSPLFIPRDEAQADGFTPDPYGRWVNGAGEVRVPLYEGRMIDQFDFSAKGWVSGKGRRAIWRDIPWEDKRIEPQFLVRKEDWVATLGGPEHDSASTAEAKLVFMAIGSATNRRSMFAAVVCDAPCGNSVPVLRTRSGIVGTLTLAACLNSLAYDFALRARLGGLNLNYFLLSETPVVPSSRVPDEVLLLSAKLCLAHIRYCPTWVDLESAFPSLRVPPTQWPLTAHERLRLRCMLDAIMAALYGLTREDFAWILKDCDHPATRLSDSAFCRRLDPKGFWRVDKTKDPELRHPILSLVAFDALLEAIHDAGGNREAGIRAFCGQHGGQGWMLPETLRLADLGVPRTEDCGAYDERAHNRQPVRVRLGSRFLPWQIERTSEGSWTECERHAAVLRDENVVGGRD